MNYKNKKIVKNIQNNSGGLFMGELYNNKLWTEDKNNDGYEQEGDNESLIQIEKVDIRNESQKKFDDIKKILKANIRFQEQINRVLLETQFDYGKLKKKLRGETVFFIGFCILIAAASYYTAKLKMYFLLTIPSVFVVMIILLLIARTITKKRFYKAHVKKCNQLGIDIENVVSQVGEILDNHVTLAEQVPAQLLKIIPQKYNKCNYDRYHNFMCDNNKNIKKRIKNKRLKIFKGIFCKSQYMFSIMDGAENNYFNTVFAYNRKESLEEATKSYLQDQE